VLANLIVYVRPAENEGKIEGKNSSASVAATACYEADVIGGIIIFHL